MDNSIVRHRRAKAVVAIVLGLLVLSRHITGAPGPQVELLRSLYGSESSVVAAANNQAVLIDPSKVDCNLEGSIFKSKKIEEDKHVYKKYISPEKFLTHKQTPQLASQNYPSTSFTQFWLFSTLPQVIHANDPPMNKSKNTYSFNSVKQIGDRDYSYETQSCTDYRGVCINCIRS